MFSEIPRFDPPPLAQNDPCRPPLLHFPVQAAKQTPFPLYNENTTGNGAVCMAFHEKLLELRRKSGLTQEDLSEKIRVSRQTVSKWELGNSTPDLEKLVALGEALGVSLDTLVLGKEETGASPVPLPPARKDNARRWLKIAAIGFGVLLTADLISLLVFLLWSGALPK